MTEEELIKNYPRLWHMAHDGSWPALRMNGLMSAQALVEAYGCSDTEREALLRVRRPQSVVLRRNGLPDAVLRDQKPMSDSALTKCLTDGMTPSQWYELLNSHSFLWLSRDRIWRLLHAKAYRGTVQTVLTIDTRSLISAHRERVWLSPMNSGSTLFNALSRGPYTFSRISDFAFEQRTAERRRVEDNVVELLVEHSIPDIKDHVLAVHRVRDSNVLDEVWRSENATIDDHP